jgi:hypothetical protein
VGGDIENRLRFAQYLGQTRKGISPLQAGREVLGTHFDYGALTPFERNVMKRLVPFYTFTRKNLPLQVENMLTRPGRIAPQLRMAASGNVRDEFVPSHLAGGVAIPTGPESPEGNRQYISQLGLPVEEAFEKMKLDPLNPLGSIGGTIMSYAGGLNPAVKGPLEQLTGKQFFSGRDLADLRPPGPIAGISDYLDENHQYPGVTSLVSQALSNSPATRFLTTFDKIMDPRKAAWAKALNLTTGVRVSDVNVEKSRAIEARKQLEEILKRNPAISQYTRTYVKPEDKLKLSPQDIERLQVLARMNANAKAAAKLRAEQAKQRGY